MHVPLPRRDMRMLLDSVQKWIVDLSRSRSTGFVGLVGGRCGQGQSELFDALRSVLPSEELRFLTLDAFGGESLAPVPLIALAREMLRWINRDDAMRSTRQARTSEERELASVEAIDSPAGDTAPLEPRGELSDDVRRVVEALSGTSSPRAVPNGSSTMLRGRDAGARERTRLVDGMARACAEMSRRRLLVLIVEDCAHCDSLTRDFLRQLGRTVRCAARTAAPARVLVIVSAPTFDDALTLLARGERDAAGSESVEQFRLALRGYSRSDVSAVVRESMGRDIPAAQRERLLRLTGGQLVPLRWMLEAYRADADDAGRRLLQESEEGFLDRLVRERASSLERLEALVLTVCAASGRFWSAEEVGEIVSARAVGAEGAACADESAPESDVARVSAALESLRRDGWLRSRVGVHDQACYALHDAELAAAYARVACEKDELDVRQWVAQFLTRAERAPEDVVAGIQMLVDLGAPQRAAELLVPIVEWLRSLGASADALELVEVVLDAAAAGDSGAGDDLLAVRAGCLEDVGRTADALELYGELLRRASSNDDRLRLHRLRGDVLGSVGDRRRQIAEYEMALEIASGRPAEAEDLRVLAALGRAHFNEGEIEKATECLELSLDRIAEASFSEGDVHATYRLAADLHRRRGQYDRALDLERRVFEQSEELGVVTLQIDSLSKISALQLRRGKAKEAEACLLRAVRLARETGARWLLADVLSSLAAFWQNLRRPHNGLDHAREAYGICVELGRVDAEARLGLSLLALEFECGNLREASEQARRVIVATGRAGVADLQREFPETLDPGARAEHASRLEKAWRGRGLQALGVHDACFLARVLAVDGQLPTAREVLEGCLALDAVRDRNGLRLDVRKELGSLALLQGDFASGLRQIEAGLQGELTAVSRATLLDSSLIVAQIYRARGQFTQSFDAIVRALRIVQQCRSAELEFVVFLAACDFLADLGATAEALSFLDVAERASEGLPGVNWLLACSWRRGSLLTRLEGPRPAATHFDLADELASRARLPVETARHRLAWGWSRWTARDFEGAATLAREGLETARALALAPLLGDLLLLLASVECAAGNPRRNFLRAIELFEQVASLAERHGYPRLRWVAFVGLARLYRERGKHDVAAEYARRAEELEWPLVAAMPKKLAGLRWVLPDEMPERRAAVAAGS